MGEATASYLKSANCLYVHHSFSKLGTLILRGKESGSRLCSLHVERKFLKMSTSMPPEKTDHNQMMT